jgi:5-methylcytosine-specific restriction endonuclease McrA
VLLLNATFEPLGVIGPRRAAVLLLAGRVDAIGERDHPIVLHSPSTSVEIPAIVRLRSVVARRRFGAIPSPTRRGVLRRDGGRCAYCDAAADTVDHVVPRSRGGGSTWQNLVAACRFHNATKGDRLLDELGWTLQVAPTVPDGLSALGAVHVLEPAWLDYLPALKRGTQVA